MDRYVTLICGPPCAGKSTLAAHLAGLSDDAVVLDVDVIARQLGSPTRWRHEPEIQAHAEGMFLAALNQLARTDAVTAFVVRCLPNPWKRHKLARGIGAHRVMLIDPGKQTCLDRARGDRRPIGTLTSIHDWYRAYAKHPGDTTCPSPRLPSVPSPAAVASLVAAGGTLGVTGTDRTARTRPAAGMTRGGKR
jgi:energy-coupling factor transporter ATP-binding protein EcfA2